MRLQTLRAQRGLTISEASEQLGINRHTLSRLESGTQKPYGPTIKKLAEGYNVDVEELLEEPGPLVEAPQESGPSEEEERRTRAAWEAYGGGEASDHGEGPVEYISAPLDIDQIRREVAGDDWANTWPTQVLKTAVEREIERRYTDSERIEFRRQFDELIDKLAPQKETRLDEYMKAVEGYGYVSRVLERSADRTLA
jgi:transcriptional regulator with XRE-family HTH domain